MDFQLPRQRPISNYTGICGDFARATPAIADNLLILGNQSGKFLSTPIGCEGAFMGPQPAKVFAVNKNTGEPVWTTQVDDTAMSFITHSAIIFNDIAYVGIASNEELVAGFNPPDVKYNFSFRGSVAAIDKKTGQIKWKTYTVPNGYYGGAVWGSTGAVDPKLKQLYMATGNNYSVPDDVLNCINLGSPPAQCLDANDHFDSVLAFDLKTGQINWATRGLSYDAWNVGCGLNIPGVFSIDLGASCPQLNSAIDSAIFPYQWGPDWDFAQGPILMKGGLVGTGQKSGMFWTLRADTGAVVWATQASPGGLTGGLQWGSAYDGKKIYVANSNSGLRGAGQGPGAWSLTNGSSSYAGGWSSLDPETGNISWTKEDPALSRAEGAVSVANGVMFGCNMNGTMRALNAATGAILWSYESGAPCTAGPSIADGIIYWGSGNFFGFGPHKVFAFGL